MPENTSFAQTISSSSPLRSLFLHQESGLKQPSTDQLEQLYRERSLTSYAAGLTIPLQANHVYVICRGIVQLHTIHTDGNETIVGLCGPSMAFGAALTNLHPYWATALTDTDLLPLSITEIESSPALPAALFPQIVRRLQQSEAWLAFAGKRLVTDRLRSLIVQLAQEFGQVGPSGVRIQIRLTHHQLATIIGTTRVTVTRLLRDFKQEGWLSVHRRQLIVSTQILGIPTYRETVSKK